MRADIAYHDGKIVAEHKAWPNFTSLTFRQGNHAMGLILPARMGACAAMIVEAFNAHMSEDPATIVAQGRIDPDFMVGGGGGGTGVEPPIRHEIPADKFVIYDSYDPTKHGPVIFSADGRFISSFGERTAERLAEHVRIIGDGYSIPDDEFPSPPHETGPLDSAGVNLEPGSPAMDMADTFSVEFDRVDKADTPVGGVAPNGCIRMTDMDGRKRYLTHGKVMVTTEVAALARPFGWRVEYGDGARVVISRGAYEVRIPGENAITPGPSEHVE